MRNGIFVRDKAEAMDEEDVALIVSDCRRVGDEEAKLGACSVGCTVGSRVVTTPVEDVDRAVEGVPRNQGGVGFRRSTGKRLSKAAQRAATELDSAPSCVGIHSSD